RAVHGDLEEVLARALDALLDRQRHLVGLAVADAHPRALVADDHQRGERKAATALDDLRHAVDLDNPLLQVLAGLAPSVSAVSSHRARTLGHPRARPRRAP